MSGGFVLSADDRPLAESQEAWRQSREPEVPQGFPVDLAQALYETVRPYCPPPMLPYVLHGQVDSAGRPLVYSIERQATSIIGQYTGLKTEVRHGSACSYDGRPRGLLPPIMPIQGTAELLIHYETSVKHLRYDQRGAWKYSAGVFLQLQDVTIDAGSGEQTVLLEARIGMPILHRESIEERRYGITVAEYTGELPVQPNHWTQAARYIHLEHILCCRAESKYRVNPSRVTS